jgi:ATP-dependent helicase/nuclease subunit A
MSQPMWTSAQKRAIETVGREVLVAASAGTGKTAVLSRRCVERICDPTHPADVDQLLVLTFTEAAAEEMKTRIARQLEAASRRRPADGRLRRQLCRLDAAYIGTIHSFCKRILTEYFYLADIDPRFGILDPDQRKLIRSEILTETIEAAWRDSELSEAMQTLLRGRNLRGGTYDFTEAIPRLSDFLDSVPDRAAFYDSAASVSAETLTRLESAYLLDQFNIVREMLLVAHTSDAQLAGGQYLTGYIDGITAMADYCLDLLHKNKLAACAQQIRDWSFDRMPALKKDLGVDKDDAERVKAAVENAREKIKSLKKLCFVHPDYVARIAGANTSQTQTVLTLLSRFDAAYARAKRQMNVLDFADLEHRMLHLLQSQPDAARRLRQRFEYVFIDEYQDVNQVQFDILKQVCRSDNLFVVGDVKQSIYAFRQSRPDIFLNQLAAATDEADGSGKPVRIDMNDNFRSRREILGFVNRVFSRAMTAASAGMNYDQRAELVAGLDSYPPLQGDTPTIRKAIEWYLLDQDETEENGDSEDNDNDGADIEPESAFDTITASQRQAAFIARRIRRMVGADSGAAEFEVMDKHTRRMRSVEYRDVVILMRALSHRAADYIELLRLAGIPVSSQSQCGYFAATEVTDFLSLLKTLDNPLRDIELAAVLRSAMFQFTDSHLAAIRLCAGRDAKCFYDAVVHYARQGDDAGLCRKAAAAMATLQGWRTDAQRKPLSELIRQIMDTTGFVAFVSALPNGPQRRANLLKLHDRAIQFESFVGAAEAINLSAFVEFVEKLREQETDWAPAQPDHFAENAVTVMSVHKSKGLEFPVVFLAELNRPFRIADANSACRIDSAMLGLELLDPDTGQKYPTPAHQLIRLNQLRPAIAEEMRILYVAMTRARDRLILTGSQKSAKCLAMLRRVKGYAQVPQFELLGAKSHLDWLLLALSDTPTVAGLFESDSGDIAEDDLFVASRIPRAELDTLANDIQQRKRRREKTAKLSTDTANAPETQSWFAALRRDLTWRYPYAAMTELPAKFSVSALSHRDDEFSRPQLDDDFDFKPLTHEPRNDALELGGAVHLVFQHLPLSASIDVATVEKTIAKLVAQNQLAVNIAQKINPDDIIHFFATEPGRLAIRHAAGVQREWPFTIALDVSALGLNCPNESVVVQGIVDMIIPTPAGLVIADFKTDKISKDGIAMRAERYFTQIALYARAAEMILKKPVIGGYLYFLHPRWMYPVPIQQINSKMTAL